MRARLVRAVPKRVQYTFAIEDGIELVVVPIPSPNPVRVLRDLSRVARLRLVLLIVQTNISNTYQKLRRLEEALHVKRDVYSGYVKLKGREHLTPSKQPTTTQIAFSSYDVSKKPNYCCAKHYS